MKRTIMENFSWVSKNHSFFDIGKNGTVIKWSKKPYKDYQKMAKIYFQCAYEVCEEIINNPDDNVKCDTWFFPAMYMFRQSLELMIKAMICKDVPKKRNAEDIFEREKHNLSSLFSEYKLRAKETLITSEEFLWLERYLHNLEIVDENSSLFRYPFVDDFWMIYENNFLDIVDMGNAFLMAYVIIEKCDTGVENKEIIEINTNEPTDFLRFANTGYGNCYLWKSNRRDDFYSHVTGYSRVAKFVYEKYCVDSDDMRVYPIAFLMRNAIELGLKRLLYSRTRVNVVEYKIKGIKNSHLLYKDLWKNIKQMLMHYAKDTGEDLDTLEAFEENVRELSRIDKNGDLFRYPCTYSFEYKLDEETVDLENVYNWMQGMYNLLDGCDSMLDNIADYEFEAMQYWD